MQRLDISRLRHNRSIYLKMGFAIALGFVVLAFRWEVYPPENGNFYLETLKDENAFEVVRTVHKKKTIPPPPVIETAAVDLPPDDVVFTAEPEPEPSAILSDEPTEPEITNASPPIIPKIKERDRPKREAPPEIEMPLDFAEQMPRFPFEADPSLSKEEIILQSHKALFEYVNKNLRYPRQALEYGAQGKVFVAFVVNEDGSISDVEIIKDIGLGCGKESLRIISNMPKWIPGMQHGRNVKVRMRLPLKFALEN